jgi:hypothetical protein
VQSIYTFSLTNESHVLSSRSLSRDSYLNYFIGNFKTIKLWIIRGSACRLGCNAMSLGELLLHFQWHYNLHLWGKTFLEYLAIKMVALWSFCMSGTNRHSTQPHIPEPHIQQQLCDNLKSNNSFTCACASFLEWDASRLQHTCICHCTYCATFVFVTVLHTVLYIDGWSFFLMQQIIFQMSILHGD